MSAEATDLFYIPPPKRVEITKKNLELSELTRKFFTALLHLPPMDIYYSCVLSIVSIGPASCQTTFLLFARGSNLAPKLLSA